MYIIDYTDEALLHMQQLKHLEPKAFRKLAFILQTCNFEFRWGNLPWSTE